LENSCRFKKFKFSKLYIDEFTVFIKVKMLNLKASVNSSEDKVNNEEIVNNEMIKIKTDKKYLLISF